MSMVLAARGKKDVGDDQPVHRARLGRADRGGSGPAGTIDAALALATLRRELDPGAGGDSALAGRRHVGSTDQWPPRCESRESRRARKPHARYSGEAAPPRQACDLESGLAAEVIRKSLRGEGDYLREEATAERFGVGRTAIRQAFSQLAGRGLIVHVPRCGWRVRAFDEADMAAYLEVREVLENKALALARPHLVDVDLRRMLAGNVSGKRGPSSRQFLAPLPGGKVRERLPPRVFQSPRGVLHIAPRLCRARDPGGRGHGATAPQNPAGLARQGLASRQARVNAAYSRNDRSSAVSGSGSDGSKRARPLNAANHDGEIHSPSVALKGCSGGKAFYPGTA